jgi:hypothetical protein
MPRLEILSFSFKIKTEATNLMLDCPNLLLLEMSNVVV